MASPFNQKQRVDSNTDLNSDGELNPESELLGFGEGYHNIFIIQYNTLIIIKIP
jgi:hypothetical protein